jgi:UDP-2,4-diacetamido-2,4,6-trideoxy-beta-L-altropyranose hydrolase
LPGANTGSVVASGNAADVLFLVEAGGKYGLGHLMRCEVLIAALRDRGALPICAIRVEKGGLPDWTTPAEITLEGNDTAAALHAEAVARARRPNWIVVDGYGLLATDLVARLRKLGFRVVVFQDLGTDGGGADLVINQNRQAGMTNAVAAGQLLGPCYALVDRSYAACRSRPLADTIRRILVTFGGTDQHSLTPLVVAAFAGVPGELSLDVVIGPYHRTRRFAPAGPHRMTLHQEPHGLAALLDSTDLVISAAGTTCWQICCAGVPLISVQTVDNQREVMRCLADEHCAITLERKEFCQLLDGGRLPALLAQLSRQGARSAMVAAQRRLVDGNGAARIVAAMGL